MHICFLAVLKVGAPLPVERYLTNATQLYMDITLLAQTAIALAMPFLNKIGEGTSRKVGEDIWALIKKPFQAKGLELNEANLEQSKTDIEQMLAEDEIFKAELEDFINQHQTSAMQQNIQNNAAIEKQVNITNNSGNLNF